MPEMDTPDMAARYLEDDVIALRAVEPEDIDLLMEWENNTSIWDYGNNLAPFSRKNITDYVQNYIPDIYVAGQLRLMITLRETGEAVGMVDIFDFDATNSRAGVGILVIEPYRRKGYALRALNLLSAYCRGIFSMHQLFAVVSGDNEPSRQLFLEAGFRTSGRLRSWLKSAGRYKDAFIYQKLF